MYIVTGGAGMLGSNLIEALNARGVSDVHVVEDLNTAHSVSHLAGLRIRDCEGRERFRKRLASHAGPAGVEAVVHFGACTSTTEADTGHLMDNNFGYTRELFEWCQRRRVPLIYASSAAVYGRSGRFRETPANERPCNAYAWSKLLFDRLLRRRRHALTAPTVGLRYFNVYGPNEGHKGGMASLARQLHHQLREHGRMRLFGGCHGYAPGEQRRDFVHVADAVAVTLWFLAGPAVSGLFNVGSGQARSFNELAARVIAFHGGGRVEYRPFPQHLQGRYQPYTCADLSGLRDAGYTRGFRPIEAGVAQYLEHLEAVPRSGAIALQAAG